MPEIMTTAKANRYIRNGCEVYEDEGMAGIYNRDSVRINLHNAKARGYIACRYDKIDEAMRIIKRQTQPIIDIEVRQMHMRINILCAQDMKAWVLEQLKATKDIFNEDI